MGSPKDGITYTSIAAILLAALITAFCMKQMEPYPPLSTHWWLSFIVINIAYIAYGMRKGWVKFDPANGLVIATGPFAFYFWTIIAVWTKYGPKRKKVPEKEKIKDE